MTVFKQVAFKRNYDCTNIVAVVGESLPSRFSSEVFKPTKEREPLAGLTFLRAELQDGQRVELYGYL